MRLRKRLGRLIAGKSRPSPRPETSRPQSRSDYYFLAPDLALTRLENGLMLYVDPQDETMSAHMIAYGYWEAWIYSVVMSLIAPGDSVVEVGANVGYYTTAMASAVGPKGSVTALEANARLIELIRRSITLNGMVDRVTLVGKAAMDQPGTVQFMTSRSRSGFGFVNIWDTTPFEDSQTSDVEAVRLDDLGAKRVDLIRLDAEGSEPFILRGADAILKANDKIVIVLEWSVVQMSSRTSVDEFVAWLAAMGFRFWRIEFDASLSPVKLQDLTTLPGCDLVVSRYEPDLSRGTR